MRKWVLVAVGAVAAVLAAVVALAVANENEYLRIADNEEPLL